MPKGDRNGKSSHAGVKGEFVGKPVPPDGNGISPKKETGPNGSGVNRKQEHISIFVSSYAPVEAIFVNSLRVIYV